MITTAVLCLVILAPTAFAQEFKCPHEYGFYPHQRSCDKYYKCENSSPSLKTCGNGLGFEASDPKYLTENCDYLHNVDCGDRSELEPPIGSANCPRLYGIFPDEQRCDTFWSCWNGESNKYTCAPGLAYDRDARVCMWADQVPECKVTETDGGFKCPNPLDNPNPGTFSRHAHPEDCRKYYICLDGSPREYGCPIGTVFQIGGDAYSGQCTDPEGVEGCENYYGDDLKGIRKSELLLGLTGGESNGNGNSGNYNSVTQRPTIRKKVPQNKPVEVAPQTSQSIQSGQRVQQQQQTRERVRPAQQQQQQQQQQQVSRPQAQPQQVSRPQPPPQQQTRPAPVVTTSRPVATTEAPKPTSDKNDDYYYYDNYEDVPAQGQQPKQA